LTNARCAVAQYFVHTLHCEMWCSHTKLYTHKTCVVDMSIIESTTNALKRESITVGIWSQSTQFDALVRFIRCYLWFWISSSTLYYSTRSRGDNHVILHRVVSFIYIDMHASQTRSNIVSDDVCHKQSEFHYVTLMYKWHVFKTHQAVLLARVCKMRCCFYSINSVASLSLILGSLSLLSFQTLMFWSEFW
jgi:hypothetical protein